MVTIGIILGVLLYFIVALYSAYKVMSYNVKVTYPCLLDLPLDLGDMAILLVMTLPIVGWLTQLVFFAEAWFTKHPLKIKLPVIYWGK